MRMRSTWKFSSPTMTVWSAGIQQAAITYGNRMYLRGTASVTTHRIIVMNRVSSVIVTCCSMVENHTFLENVPAAPARNAAYVH